MDLQVIEEESQDLGLVLINQHKSEVICSDPSSRASLLPLILDAKLVAPSAATLLGSFLAAASLLLCSFLKCFFGL